jgi:hypothetical protein
MALFRATEYNVHSVYVGPKPVYTWTFIQSGYFNPEDGGNMYSKMSTTLPTFTLKTATCIENT